MKNSGKAEGTEEGAVVAKDRKLKCRYCRKPGFANKRTLRAHERQIHKVFQRKGNGRPEPKPGRETIVQEPICYCPFCGKQLPNATIIRN